MSAPTITTADAAAAIHARTRRQRAIVKAGLTPRELQVLAGISQGYTYKQIGRQLYVTVDTVKSHVGRLFRKLGVNDRAHAVNVAWQLGILGGVS
jgi:DNA-binding CsgD family transcriptional regulator